MRTAIVGAGAAGLSLALMTDDDVVLFERECTTGGLCRSATVAGFTFDRGPHILGGIPEAVEWVLAHTPTVTFETGETCNRGVLDGEFVAHPFEEAAVGQQYMAKMWKIDPDRLSLPALGAQRGRRPGGVPTFRYPAEGGYQAITDAWTEVLDRRIVRNHAFASEEDAATLARSEGFDRVVWTAPREGEAHLHYNALVTVTAGFEGAPPRYTALYLPEPWTPFHRLSFPSRFARSAAPDGGYSVQGEASFDKLPERPELLADQFLAALDRLGLAASPPVFVHLEVLSHAYPVPTVGDVAATKTVEGVPFFMHGRSGSFRYLNLDGVVKASMELAERMKSCTR